MLICSLTPLGVPANLKNRVGASLQVLSVAPAAFMHFIWTSSRISIAAIGTPAPTTAATQVAACLTLSKLQTATLVLVGFVVTFKVASVTRPRVPSLPMNIFVKSYPALLFRGL